MQILENKLGERDAGRCFEHRTVGSVASAVRGERFCAVQICSPSAFSVWISVQAHTVLSVTQAATDEHFRHRVKEDSQNAQKYMYAVRGEEGR